MIRIHPRSQIVSKADHDFAMLLLNHEQKYEMTYEELFAFIADCADALSAGMLRGHNVARALTPPKTPKRTKRLHEFSKGVSVIQENYDLTYGEWFSILSRRIGDYAKSLIRVERHPDDPDKPGDEA